MRIESSYNNAVSNHENLCSSMQDKAKGNSRTGAASDAVLGGKFETLLKLATKSSEIDYEAVNKAKELLKSGELDSLEFIFRSAERLLKYGI